MVTGYENTKITLLLLKHTIYIYVSYLKLLKQFIVLIFIFTAKLLHF